MDKKQRNVIEALRNSLNPNKRTIENFVEGNISG